MGIDPFIQQELNRKLRPEDWDRCGKVNKFGGSKPPREKTEEEKLQTLAEGRASRLRAKEVMAAKVKQVLDYYADTTVPFERIAQHTKLKPKIVAEEMKARGRLS